MLFNSFEFVIFFIVVATIYFALPYRFQWIILLLSSYLFYMAWKAEYVLLILLSTVIDYSVARMLENTIQERLRKLLLLTSITTNLAILIGFKYANFFRGKPATVFATV